MTTTTQTPAAAAPPIIPEQRHVTWAVTLQVSWAGIKRRFFRSLITMS